MITVNDIRDTLTQPLAQPLLLYNGSVSVEKTIVINQKTHTLPPASEFPYGIYFHKNQVINIKIDNQEFPLNAAASAEYSLDEIDKVYEIVHVESDRNMEVTTVFKRSPPNISSPLVIDGECPHQFLNMDSSEYSSNFQRSTYYLNRLGLPSTRAASIAVAMYSACYVLSRMEYQFGNLRGYMTRSFVFMNRLLKNAVLYPIYKGALLPVETRLKRIDKYTTYMLCALPYWTLQNWNANAVREIMTHFNKLFIRRVDKPLPITALPYACVQFYPNRTLEEQMMMMSLSLNERMLQIQSFKRLKYMGVGEEEANTQGRIDDQSDNNDTSLEFGIFAFDTALDDPKVLQMMWDMRAIWTNRMDDGKTWHIENLKVVFMTPFGCVLKPLIQMNEPNFAQFPVSSKIFIDTFTKYHIQPEDPEDPEDPDSFNLFMDQNQYANALMLYQTTNNQLHGIRANLGDPNAPEYARAFLFNVDRLLQLMLLHHTLFSNVPMRIEDTTKTEQRFALALFRQLLNDDETFKTYVKTNETTGLNIKLPSAFDASVPLGELVFAYSLNNDLRAQPVPTIRPITPAAPLNDEESGDEFQDAVEARFKIFPSSRNPQIRAPSPPIPIPLPTLDLP
jgi:hypothetical protein